MTWNKELYGFKWLAIKTFMIVLNFSQLHSSSAQSLSLQWKYWIQWRKTVWIIHGYKKYMHRSHSSYVNSYTYCTVLIWHACLCVHHVVLSLPPLNLKPMGNFCKWEIHQLDKPSLKISRPAVQSQTSKPLLKQKSRSSAVLLSEFSR